MIQIRSRIHRRCNKFKKYAKIILPHVGLILLSTVYILTGAAVFYHVEKPYEMNVRSWNLRLISEQRNALLDKMWRLSKDEAVYETNAWQMDTVWDLENLTRTLFDAFDTHYVEAAHLIITNETNIGQQYDYRTYNAAVFFSSTLLTTIGYGNLVPVTFEGRVFCICYGLLGVPLVLITVTDIGKFLSEHITATYGKYSRWKKRTKPRYLQLKRDCIQQRRSVVPEVLASACDRQHLVIADQQSAAAVRKLSVEEEDGARLAAADDLESFVAPPAELVPTPIILSILLGYMVLGAWLLSYLEQWTFFDAFYFAFISLTTIGFGDFVPENHSYYIFDMLYIVVGLSITTMCIDLVGAQYIEKIHNFGRAIKDARYALINVGGKMVQVRDLMKYSALLHRKYGLTEARARQLERDGSFSFGNVVFDNIEKLVLYHYGNGICINDPLKTMLLQPIRAPKTEYYEHELDVKEKLGGGAFGEVFKVLIKSENVEVSDFGLSYVDERGEGFELKASQRLPLKWLAPECFASKTWTMASDVWSYGILMWEVYENGREPYTYPGDPCTAQELAAHVVAGKHPRRPALLMRDDVYSVMLKCWRLMPESRLTMRQVDELLSQAYERDVIGNKR